MSVHPTAIIDARAKVPASCKVGPYCVIGAEVELGERDVVVYRFEERWREGPRRGFAIECSAGTYVRSLIADLGDAYCEELRRTRIGRFDVRDADPGRIVPLDEALTFLPEVRLDDARARRAQHGGRIELDPGEQPREGVVRLIDEQGLIGVAQTDAGSGLAKPLVVLRRPGHGEA